MGFYADQLLPRCVNVVMNTGELRKQRSRVLAPLAGTVLELGFGSGLNLPHYPADVERLLAVDPATTGRKLAKQRLDDVAFPVDFAGLDGQVLELDDDSVDAVVVTWSLCTIPAPGKALQEAKRVLRPGGRLHFVEHGLSPDTGTRGWQDRLNSMQRFLAGGCNLNRPIDALVAASGLAVEELETFYMPGTPRWLGFTYRGVARKAVSAD